MPTRLRLALLLLALAAAGCGRTSLFGARPRCSPTDSVCQNDVLGGSAGGSGFAGTGSSGAAGRGAGGSSGSAGSSGLACAARREICANGIDDNCNGLVDCADPGCFGDVACAKPGREICNNGIDDNDNGLVDCADPECFASIVCQPTMGHEICDNGVDDNGDGLVDCADPRCTTFPACLNATCAADVDFGTIASHDAKIARTVDTKGSTQAFATCATPGGDGRVGSFVLTETTDVRLDFSQTSGSAHVVALFRAGAGQACDRNSVACVNAGDAASTTQAFPALAAGTYWLIVESYPGTQGATTVTLSTGSSTKVEICDNGIDDDGNGLIDCQDSACVNAPNCVAVECKPDTMLGALVVGDPAKRVRVDLTRAPDRYKPLCAGKTPGGDAAVAFTLAQAGGFEIAFRQTGHTIFSLFRQPTPGMACDNPDNLLSCTPEDDAQGATAFSDLAAGKYLLVFKATTDASGKVAPGILNLEISAFQNRRVEICNNGIDDDGNGLVDCQDPACFGVDGCAPLSCTPDADLGAFSWGTTQSTTVDTRGGGSLYQTTCSKGNGKERVLRLSLTQPMALGVDCMDGGSHVLELSQQIAPLDLCDAHSLGCADPSVLPFGCGYAIPDLQPGQYNLIVQAFQAGDEGVVSISLTGQKEIVREICNNGIDDDMDGFTDCADRKCATSPFCEKAACRPQKTLGLLPLDGSVLSAVIQTTGAGDNETHTACVSAPGGQDGDVDFELPAKADLTIDWAQVGSHVFAVYSDDGMLLSCEAGTSFTCIPSGSQPTGAKIVTGLPAGKYHLVVDADKPGSEGGVALQLSGKASP
jgi:hypothetical protein